MVSECQARAISIFADIQECSKVIKMPTFRGKDICIGDVVIESIDGVIANTPSKTRTLERQRKGNLITGVGRDADRAAVQVHDLFGDA